MNNKIIHVGIIGTGSIGAQHARVLRTIPGAVLFAISDLDVKRMELLSREIGVTRIYKDPNELIRSVDAVIVASPDKTHAEYVLKALELEKPVFCEKPLASTPQEALDIVKKEVTINKRLVSVGFNRRFDPRHQEVRRTVLEEKLGKPLLWKGYHRNAEAMYDTDGCFILNNSAGHDIDSACWILNSAVKRISTVGMRSRKGLPKEARDLLLVRLEMENGTQAVAEIFVNARYGYEVGLEIVCQDGVVTMGNRQKACLRSGEKRGFKLTSDFREYFFESYRFEITSWIDSLLTSSNFSGASAYDGYRALLTTFAAGKSLMDGVPVKVETVEEPSMYGGQ